MTIIITQFVYTLLLLLSYQSQTVDGKTPLYVGGLFGMSNHWWGKYGSFYRIMYDIVFEEISNRTDILQDYEIHFTAKDTQGNGGLAGKRLAELVYEAPPKVAVLGPPLSNEMQLVGQMTGWYNTVQVGFLAKTSSVKDRDSYSSLFMTNYIEDDLNPLRIAIMKHFDWRKVGTLIFDQDIFVSQISEFHQSLVKNNFTLLTSGIITDITQISEHITRLKQYDTRIIYGAFRSTKAPEIFCEVYRQGLYGKKYVWILTGASMYDGWIKALKESQISCSKQNLYTVTHGYIALNQKAFSHENHVTISGRTPDEYNTWINNIKQNYPDMALSYYHPFAYDAAWAIALGLNNSLSYLNNTKLEDFSYEGADIYDAIKKGMENVKFSGVSGPVSFQDGRRIGYSFVEQNVGDERKTVGIFHPDNESIEWYIDPLTLFEGMVIPKDSVTYATLMFPFSFIATGFIIFLAICGVFVGIAFLVFNIYFRNNRYIKMSSPYINNVIILGGLMMYFSVIMSSIDYSTSYSPLEDHICMIKAWVISLGFTAAFGALFSKTWRVHYLFRNRDLRKKSMKDQTLFALIGVLLIIDAVILIPWSLTHPLKKKKDEETFENEDTNVVTTHVLTTCENEKQMYWISALYVYKGLLLAFGAFMAWETRKVTIPSLNDSKYIGFCVYNIVVVCSLFIPLSHFLPPRSSTLRYILQNCVMVFTTTLVLCIVFLPKVKLRNTTENVTFVKNLNERKPRTLDSDASTSKKKPNTKQQLNSSGDGPCTEQISVTLLTKNSNLKSTTNIEQNGTFQTPVQNIKPTSNDVPEPESVSSFHTNGNVEC